MDREIRLCRGDTRITLEGADRSCRGLSDRDESASGLRVAAHGLRTRVRQNVGLGDGRDACLEADEDRVRAVPAGRALGRAYERTGAEHCGQRRQKKDAEKAASAHGWEAPGPRGRSFSP